jgi:putative flippase GtrA
MFALQALLNVVVSSVVLLLAARILFAYVALPSIVVGDLAKVLSSVVATTLSFLILRYVVFRDAKT